MGRRLMTVGLILVALAASVWSVAGATAQTATRCFPETGLCISGRFRSYWEQNGGLAVFGFPLSQPFVQDGRTAQIFERERFELHAENQAPYDVLLGRLGDEALRRSGTDWNTLPKFDPASGAQADCQYFPQTGHAACGVFRTYWAAHGLEFDGNAGTSAAESLALFGYPLSEPAPFTTGDGTTVQAQWFERARFEYHPNNPAPYIVLLGRLGADLQPPAPAPSGDAAPAVQTVIDYYRAINARTYDQAYRQWANNGAASGQTLAQFTQGYASTVQVGLLLATPQGPDAAGNVTVPVNLAAVVDDANGSSQHVQQFRGSYVLAAQAGGWKIASASIAPAVGGLPPVALRAPDVLLHAFYDAINHGEVASAYTFWGNSGADSGETFAQFQQGYASTAHVDLDLGTIASDAGAGSVYATVPAVVIARQSNGSQQTYCGSYKLRRSNLPPFDMLGWHITGASVAPVANVQPGSAQSQRLLSNNCTP